MAPRKQVVTGLKLEILKGRTDKPTTSRRITEAMLVEAVGQLSELEDTSGEEVFAGLLETVGAVPAGEEPAEVAEEDALLNILDGNIDEVTEAIDELSGDDLRTLLKAEQDGKTRKGVVEAIEELLTS